MLVALSLSALAGTWIAVRVLLARDVIAAAPVRKGPWL